MKKLSRKQRQLNYQPRPDYSKIHIESIMAENREYWEERMESNPLSRYKTHHTAESVVNVIKATDPEGVEAPPNIYFDRDPKPLDEAGTYYNFYVEYRTQRPDRDTPSKKVGHVEGAVISGETETILEFRSTQTPMDRLFEAVGSFLTWVLFLVFIFCLVSWFLSLLISDGDTRTTIFALTVFMLIVFLWFVVNESKRVGVGMKAVIKQLGAVKIKDEALDHPR